MKGFLLDTNVISISSPLRSADPAHALRAWIARQEQRLYLPAVALGEISAGTQAARRKGRGRKADQLSMWLAQITSYFADRVLSVDARVASLSGELYDLARGSGEDPGWIDAQIAATAKAHELILLTRNVRHFEPMRIDFRDPFVEDLDAL